MNRFVDPHTKKELPKYPMAAPNEDYAQEGRPIARVEHLRNMILIHRYLYYVASTPIVTDHFYDNVEIELKNLVEKFPELDAPDCPTKTVGSSRPEDYTPRIAAIANDVWKYYMQSKGV